jgi:hypothetical protein
VNTDCLESMSQCFANRTETSSQPADLRKKTVTVQILRNLTKTVEGSSCFMTAHLPSYLRWVLLGQQKGHSQYHRQKHRSMGFWVCAQELTIKWHVMSYRDLNHDRLKTSLRICRSSVLSWRVRRNMVDAFLLLISPT